MEIDNKKDLELHLINDDHYNGHQSRSSTYTQNIVKILSSDSAKHDKIHSRVRFFQYLVLFGVGIAYFIYGYLKWTDSTYYPLTKSYDELSEAGYPLPTTLACADHKGNDTFFDIDTFFYWNWNQSYVAMNCTRISNLSILTDYHPKIDSS